MEKTADTLIEKVLAGGPEGFVSLLLLIALCLIYVIKRIYDREIARSQEQAERVKDLERQINELHKSYHEKLESVIDKYHENTKVQMESFNKINETLTKIMVKLYGA